MDYIIEASIAGALFIGALVFITVQNRKDKKVTVTKAEPVKEVEVKEIDGYKIVAKQFPYGPPTTKTTTIKGELMGTYGDYLFVPIKVVSYPQGIETWGVPAITIGTLYKKENKDG